MPSPNVPASPPATSLARMDFPASISDRPILRPPKNDYLYSTPPLPSQDKIQEKSQPGCHARRDFAGAPPRDPRRPSSATPAARPTVARSGACCTEHLETRSLTASAALPEAAATRGRSPRRVCGDYTRLFGLARAQERPVQKKSPGTHVPGPSAAPGERRLTPVGDGGAVLPRSWTPLQPPGTRPSPAPAQHERHPARRPPERPRRWCP